MLVLIDNYDSFTYNLYQIAASINKVTHVFRNDEITVDDLKTLSPAGIILSPGPGKPQDAGVCVQLIQHFHGKIPLLGICLGHQAIAYAFGGNVIHAPEIVHGKSTNVFHTRTDLYQNMPLPFVAGRYHSLVADKQTLPTDFIVQAENSEGMIMGIKHKEYPTYGMQFHPESILTPEGKRLIEAFVAIC